MVAQGSRRRALAKVSLRNIGAHKLRLALTVVAVVLGTAFIAGSMMFTNMLERTFNSAVATRYEGVDVVVDASEGAGPLDAGEAASIAASDAVARSNLSASTVVVAARTNEEAIQTRQGSARASVYYPAGEAVGQAADVVEGRAPQAGASPDAPVEVVLNAGGARHYGIELGEELIAVDTSARTPYEVVGFYDDATTQDTSLRFLLNEADYLAHYAAQDTSPGLALAGDGSESADQLADSIALDHPGVRVRTGEKAAQEASQSVRDGLSFVSYFLIAFGLVGLLVGTFLIANTFSMIVAKRAKEFALLRALGASRGQVTRSVAAEAAVVGLFGAGLGVVAGGGLVALIKAAMGRRGMELPAGGIGLSVDAVMVPVAVGVAVTLLSAWTPARRAGRVEPVEAMRANEAASPQPLTGRTVAGVVLLVAGVCATAGALAWDAGSTGRRASLVGVAAVAIIAGLFLAGPALSLPVVPPVGRAIGAPFGAAGALAATNTRRNPRRTFATAFALMLGIALVTIIGMLGASMKASVDSVADNEVSAEFVLSGPTGATFPIPGDLMERIPEVEGVGDVAAYTEAPLTVNGEYSTQVGQYGSTTALYGDPANLVRMDMVAGSSSLEGNTVIAPLDWANSRGWSVGDTVEVAAPGVSPATVTATVGGIYDNSSVLPAVVVSADVAKQLAPASADIIMLGVSGDGTVSPDQLRANLETEVRHDIVVQVQSKEDVSGEVRGLIDQMLFILYALLSLAVIIAVLGIVNTLTLSVIERRQEIGMLRAVGTLRGQVRTMIILESVQIALFGALLGVLLGLGLGWAFLTVLASKGLDSIVVPWPLLGSILAGSVVVGVLAALWPARRAASVPPLDAIAE